MSRPKPNGYQSIHTNARLADGRVVEIQLRTAAMHERATSGSAAHQEYRASQLSGGLAAMEGVARRTSHTLRAVQQPVLLPAAHDEDEANDAQADDLSVSTACP